MGFDLNTGRNYRPLGSAGNVGDAVTHVTNAGISGRGTRLLQTFQQRGITGTHFTTTEASDMLAALEAAATRGRRRGRTQTRITAERLRKAAADGTGFTVC